MGGKRLGGVGSPSIPLTLMPKGLATVVVDVVATVVSDIVILLSVARGGMSPCDSMGMVGR